MSRRVVVQAAEVTLSGATNLDKATLVRVVNDTAGSVVLTLDDTAWGASSSSSDDYEVLGARTITIVAGEVAFIEKYPLETVDGSGLKCTKIARQ